MCICMCVINTSMFLSVSSCKCDPSILNQCFVIVVLKVQLCKMWNFVIFKVKQIGGSLSPQQP